MIGERKTLPVIIGMVFVLVVFSLAYFLFQKVGKEEERKQGELKQEEVSPEGFEEYPLFLGVAPEEVVKEFMENFIKSAPPELNEAASQKALSFLTKQAQAEVKKTSPVSSGLASFVGVQDLPDRGFEISEVAKDKGAATISLKLNYSGGAITKVFHLLPEDNYWRIASVSSTPGVE